MQGMRLKPNSKKGWERKKNKMKQKEKKTEKKRKGSAQNEPFDQKLSFCLVETLPRTNDS